MGRLLRGAEKAERTQANEQPPAKGSKAEQSRAEQGREQSRAQGAGRISEHIITYYDSHIPRGGHSGQAQVLGAGAGADGVARMGKSMDRQKNFRRLSVSLSLCPSVMKGSLASTREEPEPGPEATQVARQERHFPSSSPFTFHLLPAPWTFQRVALAPATHPWTNRSSASKRNDWATPSLTSPPEIGTPPCARVESRLVETWNFPDNGGEGIVAWSWSKVRISCRRSRYLFLQLTTREPSPNTHVYKSMILV
jgi:hypothetical protein